MLPQYTVVNFMAADDVGHDSRLASRISKICIQVLDGSETIAAEGKVVGTYACSIAAEVECSLFVIW